MSARDTNEHADGMAKLIKIAVRSPECDRAFATGGLRAAMDVAMRLTGGLADPSEVLWQIRLATEPHPSR